MKRARKTSTRRKLELMSQMSMNISDIREFGECGQETASKVFHAIKRHMFDEMDRNDFYLEAYNTCREVPSDMVAEAFGTDYERLLRAYRSEQMMKEQTF